MPPSPAWSRLDDAALLDRRFCDLKLAVDGSLRTRVDQLYAELAARGLTRLRPHVWVSTEWFSPDGIPGIALPFFLAHPRLTRLERSQMLAVEGGTPAACLRILRHEAGHCFDTAYRLHRRKPYRELFGRYGDPYPDTYKPRPGSRRYVTHLPGWYAQAHPAEDFAETFAVWLGSRKAWRARYRGWPALRKLEYVDRLMSELAAQRSAPPVRSRRTPEALTGNRTTLREHYREKKLLYADEFPDFYDADLLKLFSADPKSADHAGTAPPSAAAFLRKIRPALRRDVSRWTGAYAYTIDQVLGDMIDRSKELKLRLAIDPVQAEADARMMVTVQTMNYLHAGHRPVAL